MIRLMQIQYVMYLKLYIIIKEVERERVRARELSSESSGVPQINPINTLM